MKLKEDKEKFIGKPQITNPIFLINDHSPCFKPFAMLVLLITFAIMANVSLAATYYIDPVNGSDSAAGSSSSPWKTVNKAKSTVSAGDIVNLRPGSYGAVTFTSADKKGTSSSYITYQNDPASTPYSAKFSYILFNSNSSYYITIKGFDIENTGSNDACIKTTSNTQWVKIIDCKAHGRSGGTGPSYANIFIHTSKNILIENCEVYYSGGNAFAIQLESSQYSTVRDCHVHDIVGSGIRTGGGQDYVIEYNIVHDQRVEWNSAIHGTGIAIHSINTVIRGNIVYNYGNTRPIRFYQEYAGAQGYTNMVVENNLVYKTSDFTGTQWWVEFIDVGSNCVFRNNTFLGDVSMSIVSAANSSTISIHDNIVTGELLIDPYSKWSGISDGSNLFGYLRSSGCGWRCNYDRISSSSNTRANVSFSGFFATQDKKYPFGTSYPYQLSSSCAAVNFGDSYAAETDLLKCSRVGKADAGCFEYGGTPGGGTTPPPANQTPLANAGPDQTLTDTGSNGSEQVTLDGSASSDPDGSISSYKWTENSTQIATGSKPIVTLATGTHTITLTVTDDKGATATDTVKITIAQQDTTPPAISLITAAAQNSVDIVFSKPLNATSAQNAANYKIDNGISVTTASLNNNTVTLTTSALTELAQYKVTCSNISDSTGNLMPQTTKPCTYSPGIVGSWMFDESSGQTVQDYSGKANNGTLVNGTLHDATGALSFDGTNDSVSCGTGSSLNTTGSLTVTACINPSSFGQGGYGRIVDKSNGSTGYSVMLEEATQSLAYVIYGGQIVRSNSQAIKLNQWQHIAVVYDQSNSTVAFYVDGQPVGVADYSTPPTNSSASPFVIGIRNYDSSRAFKGLIDNVRIYDRVSAGTQIAKIYNADFPFAFYPIGDKSVYENADLSFQVVPRNSQVNIALTNTTLPSQPSFVNNLFNWHANYGDAGSYTATFTASDGQIEDSQTITITVNHVNQKPVIQPVGNKHVDENITLTFNVVASDPDGDQVTCSAQNLPVGAVFANNTFQWTPSYDQAGTYTVNFIASDRQLEAAQTVTITVNDVTIPGGSDSTAVIIDNGDPGTSFTGTWQISGAAGSYGSASVWSRDGDTYTYTFNAPKTGYYNLDMYWTQWPSRSSSVPVVITSAQGTSNITIDQQLNGGQWNNIGKYLIVAGSPCTVTIISQPDPASTCADAVRFTLTDDTVTTPPQDAVVIIDNKDAQTSWTGTWQISGGTGSYGQDSVWSRAGDTFSFIFAPSVSGNYDLEMWWTNWSSRSRLVPVKIANANGTSTVYINQQRNGSRWNLLGTYPFNVGTSYMITIVSQPGPASTCADAVRFTLKP